MTKCIGNRFFSLLLSRRALLLLVSLSDLALVFCQPLNRSIDDTLGDSVTGQRPLFLPTTIGVWEDNTCRDCALQPPASSAFAKTYTAATYNSSLNNISITFEFTAANFTLDGYIAGSIDHSLDTSAPAFQFNESALAFSKTGLENSTHQMVGHYSSIYLSRLNQNLVRLLAPAALLKQSGLILTMPCIRALFSNISDLCLELTEDSTTVTASSSSFSDTSGSSSKQTGIIAGAVAGGLVILNAAIAGLVFYCRSQSQKRWHRVLSRKLQHHNIGRNMHVDPFCLPAQQNHANPFAYEGRKERKKKKGLIQIAATNSPSLGPVSSSPLLLGPPISRKIVPMPTASASAQIPAVSASAQTSEPAAELRQLRRRELERQMKEISNEIEQLRSEQTVFMERQEELAQALGINDELLPGYSNS
ncbi:hypothetical protein GYMLUDRAFT_84605 [Collybiopsis luxurians FD-317 M1]|uniref:Uncharacterized protein n=1 Tax=Collybiopsis luxurians FD-317 M1 TaxID=944289 RepID=A0A0D0C0Z6_9AGAR|nr:hypothetical protein GYMLUDRAFT_84605 [Collybiopsis luxurians FD-317 M1]